MARELVTDDATAIKGQTRGGAGGGGGGGLKWLVNVSMETKRDSVIGSPLSV